MAVKSDFTMVSTKTRCGHTITLHNPSLMRSMLTGTIQGDTYNCAINFKKIDRLLDTGVKGLINSVICKFEGNMMIGQQPNRVVISVYNLKRFKHGSVWWCTSIRLPSNSPISDNETRCIFRKPKMVMPVKGVYDG